MAGRRPKPTHMRLLEGNPGKRPVNQREPKPERGKPACPAHLSDRARKTFRTTARMLDRMGTITKADGIALELLSSSYDDFLSAREQIKAAVAEVKGSFGDGMCYESTNVETGQTIIRAHPAVAIADRAAMRTAMMLTHFGLTPSSRSKVQVLGDDAVDPFDELLRGSQATA